MSHTCTIKIQMKDESLILRICKTLGLVAPVKGKLTLYDGKVVEGLLVKLPGWKYQVAVNTCSGEVSYDNYNGAWGDKKELDKLTQHYGASLYEREMKKRGYMVSKVVSKDGSIKVKAVQYA